MSLIIAVLIFAIFIGGVVTFFLIKKNDRKSISTEKIHNPLNTNETDTPSLTGRTLIYIEQVQEFNDSNGLLKLKASVDIYGKELSVTSNNDLIKGVSWLFTDEANSSGSDFTDKIFATENIDKILFHGNKLTLYRKSAVDWDWKSIATKIGKEIRLSINENKSLFPESLYDQILSDTEYEKLIDKLLVEKINPELSSHNGFVTVDKVVRNTLYIELGGGCQGCSAARDTIKFGIDRTLRENIPTLGAIIDITNHESGSTPYYT